MQHKGTVKETVSNEVEVEDPQPHVFFNLNLWWGIILNESQYETPFYSTHSYSSNIVAKMSAVGTGMANLLCFLVA